MAYCKTPPFLEGASLSQIEIEKLTCTEPHMDTENDDIMHQINNMYNDFLDNFTMTNSSNKVRREFNMWPEILHFKKYFPNR